MTTKLQSGASAQKLISGAVRVDTTAVLSRTCLTPPQLMSTYTPSPDPSRAASVELCSRPAIDGKDRLTTTSGLVALGGVSLQTAETLSCAESRFQESGDLKMNRTDSELPDV